jgi:hypothetical protein
MSSNHEGERPNHQLCNYPELMGLIPEDDFIKIQTWGIGPEVLLHILENYGAKNFSEYVSCVRMCNGGAGYGPRVI